MNEEESSLRHPLGWNPQFARELCMTPTRRIKRTLSKYVPFWSSAASAVCVSSFRCAKLSDCSERWIKCKCSYSNRNCAACCRRRSLERLCKPTPAAVTRVSLSRVVGSSAAVSHIHTSTWLQFLSCSATNARSALWLGAK